MMGEKGSRSRLEETNVQPRFSAADKDPRRMILLHLTSELKSSIARAAACLTEHVFPNG
jgi:hypothetical protein